MLGMMAVLFWLVVFASPWILGVIKAGRTGIQGKRRAHHPLAGAWALGGLVLMAILFIGLQLWTNLLWFRELGYERRFWTEFWTKGILFLVAGSISGLFVFANAWVIRHAIRKYLTQESFLFSMIARIIGVAIALFSGLASAGCWQEVLLFLNRVPFNLTDPVFGRDLSFYIFVMQLYDPVSVLAMGITVIILPLMIVAYILILAQVGTRSEDVKKGLIWYGFSHASALGIILVLGAGFNTWLARFRLLYSERGAVFGAGWTDLHFQLPAYWVFMAALLVALICFVTSAFSKSHKRTIGFAIFGFGGSVLVWVLSVVLLPAAIQQWYVSPNKTQLETQYLVRDIESTRKAYGLEKVVRSEFPVKEGITAETLKQDAETLESARLWDWQVLISTNHQVQALRPYYVFEDVDVVRYTIGGKLTQVMYSTREMDVNRFVSSAQTWQNRHLVYTHGFGGTANPVNVFTPEGLPEYWLKDVPPVAKYPELEIRQPRIYFGEATKNHVYVKTRMPEFDYPQGDNNATFIYDGPGGIPMGGFFRKLAFAWRFDGLQMLISSELTSDSRIMFNRDVDTRMRTIAPFLRYEDDIYQVVSNGELWFMRDAYTTSNRYPYSQPLPHDDLNYIRNSVKVVVNAYTGKVDFYVWDEQDPIIQAYGKTFPGLFQPASNMPDHLRKHVRYPEDLLRIQGRIWANYHMDNPSVFYNKEDAWEFPKSFSPRIDRAVTVSPYYVVMAFPNSHSREFVLILPFTPYSPDETHPRTNMVGWFAARCDGEHYGELLLYTFPKSRLVEGPQQIGFRINEDTTISKDFTLWNQQGSQVLLGDLRILPLSDDRLLYVQPVYLQASGNKMPQLKKIVAATGNRLAYEDTFEKALATLVGLSAPAATTQVMNAPGAGTQDPIGELLSHLDAYLQFMRSGQFARAGQELEAITNLRSRIKGK